MNESRFPLGLGDTILFRFFVLLDGHFSLLEFGMDIGDLLGDHGGILGLVLFPFEFEQYFFAVLGQFLVVVVVVHVEVSELFEGNVERLELGLQVCYFVLVLCCSLRVA